jgi:hypothetical protein
MKFLMGLIAFQPSFIVIKNPNGLHAVLTNFYRFLWGSQARSLMKLLLFAT